MEQSITRLQPIHIRDIFQRVNFLCGDHFTLIQLPVLMLYLAFVCNKCCLFLGVLVIILQMTTLYTYVNLHA